MHQRVLLLGMDPKDLDLNFDLLSSFRNIIRKERVDESVFWFARTVLLPR